MEVKNIVNRGTACAKARKNGSESSQEVSWTRYIIYATFIHLLNHYLHNVSINTFNLNVFLSKSYIIIPNRKMALYATNRQ